MRSVDKSKRLSANPTANRLAMLWAFGTLVVSLALCPPCRALNPQDLMTQLTHTSWTAREGVPGPVRAIAQTRDGYLWLGTEAGLYRFDGLHFVAWEASRGEWLPASSVLSLCLARDGSLWIGFSTGAISQLSNGHLKNFVSVAGLPRGKILSLAEGDDGTIWAAGQYAFGKIEGGEWHRVGVDEGYMAPAAQCVVVDRKGNVLVATDGYDFGLIHDEVRRNTVLTLPKGASRFSGTGIPVGFVPSMVEGPDGTIWIAGDSNSTIIRMASETGRTDSIQGKGLHLLSCMLFDRDQSVWLGFYGDGLHRITYFRDANKPPSDKFGYGEGLSGGTVFSDFQDREGNIWFGTESGLDRFSQNKITPFPMPEVQTRGQLIGLAASADGSVWMFEYSGPEIHRYRAGQFTSSELPRNLPSARSILSFYPEENGTVWLGGEFGLARFADGRFSFVPVAENRRGGPVEALAKGRDGSLWISFWDADSVERPMRLKQGVWTDFRESVALPKYRCRVLRGDSAGRMWLGYEDGEVAVYENTGFRIYSSKDGLTGGRVNTIFENSKGEVWIASDGGLSRFDNGHFATLTATNGLPGPSVAGILEDDEGSFWLAGSMGILKTGSQELSKALDSSSYRMQGTVFDAGDGLRSMPRQREPYPTVARTPDGRLWFSTANGLATIEPRRVPQNLIPPPVTIEEVRADGRTLSSTDATKTTFRPNTKVLQIEYTALSLMAPERVRFRYRLDGFDPDWHGPVSTREATYTNLPPRDYRFRVIACNNDGVWNNEGTSFEFNIAPAFYQTNWFLLLCAAVLAFLAWAASQWRVRQAQDRAHIQMEERLSERTRIARDLHDTLLQSFQGLILGFQKARNLLPARTGDAMESLDNALDQAEHALEEGRDAIHDIRSSPLDGGDLAKEVTALGEELISDNGQPTSPTFHVLVEGPAQALNPIVRDEIYRIVREAVRNASRHAQARRIEAEISYSQKLLKVRIRDDGKGINEELLGEMGRVGHYGLRGMRERASHIGGRLEVWSELGAGTEIQLTVPSGIAFGPDSQNIS